MKNSLSKGDLRKTAKIRVPSDYAWNVLGTLTEDLRSCLGDKYDDLQRVTRSRDHVAYLRLFETWETQGKISDDMPRSEFFAAYQATSLLKKFRFPSGNSDRKAAAIEKFKAAETACANFNSDGFKTLRCLKDEEELNVFTHSLHFLKRLLGAYLPSQTELTLWSRHGPGSNLDTVNRSVSLYDKYKNWPYSCTSLAAPFARLAIESDERWLGALEDSYRERYSIPKHTILNQEVFWSNVISVVDANRVCFVPKNSQTDRSIAIEPCMNLYLQLGVDGYIRRRLKRWGVDLDNQTKNQRLAGIGSRNWESQDSFVTLDLAAASDTISIELCRLVLPPQWFNHLMTLRSPNGCLEGETFRYEKISSMGNGFTFALESAIFFSVVYGVEMTIRGSFDRDSVAVYGDDIIVRKQSADLVIRMLNRYGFSTNLTKTHISGPFRESCGADWFKGTPVRPVFLSSSPSTVMELWCDSNRIRRILSLRRGGFEFKVCSLIDRWIPKSLLEITGPVSDENFDSYRHVNVPTVTYANGLWKFKRLVVSPKRLKGDNFLFRKLMHTLRPGPEPPTLSQWYWGGAKVTGAGSRFTIVRSNSIMVSIQSSPTSIWSDEYNDILTL